MKQAEKSVPAGRRPHPRATRRERGAALLLFMILVVMAALAYLISNLTPEDIERRRDKQTQEALVQAREALIGYALTYPDKKLDRMYGYLPMPDIGKRGTTPFEANCKDASDRPLEGCQAPPSPSLINKVDVNYLPTLVGRFPWRTLGMPPLRDGHSECLWLIVSSLALNGNATETSIPFNWDTLGFLDLQVANGGSELQSLIANRPHDRPWAIVYAPGPILSGQDRSKKANDDDVTECGGNYDARNYLDPYTLNALGGVRNSLANTHYASDDPNDFANRRANPIKVTTDGKIFKSGSNFLPNACTDPDCSPISNDRGLALNADTLFQAVRKRGFDSSTNAIKQPSFLFDVKDMLDKMTTCARDQVAAGQITSNGKVNPACSTDLESFGPKGYYRNYGDQAFVATCAGCQVTVDDILQPSCSGALLFASQRGTNQLRFYDDATSTDHRLNPDNYLDGENDPDYNQNRENYKSGGSAFSGPQNLGPIKADRNLPADQSRCRPLGPGSKWKSTSECQTKEQDIVRCIPTGASFTTVSSPSLGANQLAAYNPATRTLTLGRLGIESDEGYPAAALYGCAWLADVRTLGSGLHTYFRFQFKKPEPTSTVGSNGFVFALADAARNSFLSCGAAGSHLGYSGYNGTTQINFPKIGIEFDQGRNPNFDENADPTRSGRNDPCGTSFCGGSVGYNSHAAIVYWGHEVGGTDGVTMPDYDDNVHGFPTSPVGSRPPPTNPATAPGIQFINMRGYPDSSYDSRVFHVRVEMNQIAFRQLAAVRVASGTNVDLSNPGASIDSTALSAGHRVLVNAQTSPAENGVYVWQGASTPMTRAEDADSPAEISGATVQVLEGTYAGPAWVQPLTVTTLGTDPQTWQPHVRKFRAETWIEPQPDPPADPLPDTIIALKNITRPMSLLYSTYASTLSNTATMYPIAGGSCPCTSGQICGTDNLCYRPALQSVQLGFTGSQRTQDQEVTINDFFTTWLP